MTVVVNGAVGGDGNIFGGGGVWWWIVLLLVVLYVRVVCGVYVVAHVCVDVMGHVWC